MKDTTSSSGQYLGHHSRRHFIGNLTKAFGSAALLSSSMDILAAGSTAEQKTVGEIMDLFIKEVPGAPFPQTVDTLKAGNRDIKVNGIVTTMFATVEVIRKSIALGANFIIAHEPTFYNHQDDTAWLANDKVYQYKSNLLKEHNMAVWRNHDYIHSHRPDGVISYLVNQLGWQSYYNVATSVARLPAVTLKKLIQDTRQKLNISQVRFIGDLDQQCERVLLMPGAAGGKRQIANISKEVPDVLICGEIQEWETAEYVRDARAKGDKLALIVLGHIQSEEAGSEYMAEWLKKNVPSVKVTHIRANESLSFF